MDEKPKVSVILPVYNSEKYINQTLKSIYDQEYKSFEVLIMNDGSTDKSSNIIQKFVSTDCRFKLFNLKNNGQGIARYIGINKARGKYIAFIDSDDFVKKTWLKVMVSDMETHNVDMVSVNYLEHYDKDDNDIAILGYSNEKMIGQKDIFTEWCKDKKLKGFLWNKLFKREILMKNNIRLKFSFMEDSYVLANSIFNTQSIYFDNRCEYYYRFLEQSSINSGFHSRDIYSIKFFLEIKNRITKLYPSLSELFELRISKIELFLMMRMNYNQLLENKSLINNFNELIDKNNLSLDRLYNPIDIILVKKIKAPKSAYICINIRKYLLIVQKKVRNISNRGFLK